MNNASLLILVSLLVLAGCTVDKTAAKITFSEGCLLQIEGLTFRQAKDLISSLETDEGCKVIIERQLTSFKKDSYE